MKLYVFEDVYKASGEEWVYQNEWDAVKHMMNVYAHFTRLEWEHRLKDPESYFRMYGIEIPSETLDDYNAGEGVNLLEYEIPGTEDNPLKRARTRLEMDKKTRVCAEMLDSFTGAWDYATADDVAKAWEHDFFTEHEIDGDTYIWYMDPDGVEADCDDNGNIVNPKWIEENVIR